MRTTYKNTWNGNKWQQILPVDPKYYVDRQFGGSEPIENLEIFEENRPHSAPLPLSLTRNSVRELTGPNNFGEGQLSGYLHQTDTGELDYSMEKSLDIGWRQ
jgi:hypothetical protein